MALKPSRSTNSTANGSDSRCCSAQTCSSPVEEEQTVGEVAERIVQREVPGLRHAHPAAHAGRWRTGGRAHRGRARRRSGARPARRCPATGSGSPRRSAPPTSMTTSATDRLTALATPPCTHRSMAIWVMGRSSTGEGEPPVVPPVVADRERGDEDDQGGRRPARGRGPRGGSPPRGRRCPAPVVQGGPADDEETQADQTGAGEPTRRQVVVVRQVAVHDQGDRAARAAVSSAVAARSVGAGAAPPAPRRAPRSDPVPRPWYRQPAGARTGLPRSFRSATVGTPVDQSLGRRSAGARGVRPAAVAPPAGRDAPPRGSAAAAASATGHRPRPAPRACCGHPTSPAHPARHTRSPAGRCRCRPDPGTARPRPRRRRASRHAACRAGRRAPTCWRRRPRCPAPGSRPPARRPPVRSRAWRSGGEAPPAASTTPRADWPRCSRAPRREASTRPARGGSRPRSRRRRPAARSGRPPR